MPRANDTGDDGDPDDTGVPSTVIDEQAPLLQVGVSVKLEVADGTDSEYVRTVGLNEGCSVPELTVSEDKVASLLFNTKVYVTDFAVSIVSWQVPGACPAQSPPQVPATWLESGSAVSVTGVPTSYEGEHTPGQVAPPGVACIEPPPPVTDIDSVTWLRVNVAVADLAWLMVT